ncbi:MAG: energy transducer TonB [Gammaproteobacteria bacterium]|nr:energy transducer TonB [Gammaproteobacteria bacterium]
MAAYVHDANFFSRRAIVLAVAFALHVFLAWALATGLAKQVIELVAPPIDADIVEQVENPNEPPPPPPPEMERPPVEVPPPAVSIDIPIETTTSTALTNVTDKPRPVAPPPPPKTVQKVHARIDPKRFPSSEEYYPPSAKRLGQEGSPVIRVCVGPDGRLTEPPSVAQSSGTAALDEGALKVAKAGRYIAGTEDGKPVTDCLTFKVTFQLRN